MSTGLLKKENILLDSNLEIKEEVIKSLAEKLYEEGIITDFEGFLKDGSFESTSICVSNIATWCPEGKAFSSSCSIK